MKVKGTVILLIGVIFVLRVNAYSADYPVKPITLMVPWPAGGVTDTGARIWAAIAEKKMGQPIVVINKPGAGSQVGLTELTRQKPDGYYFGCVSLPALNTIILDPERKATFDFDAFLPIINQVSDPGLIWVKIDSPYRTLKDLLDDAKKRPGMIRAAASGILGDDHLAIIMVEEAAGVKFRIVQFDGSPQQVAATLGGQVDVSFDNVGSVTQRVKAGQVRALAVMDIEKSKFLPNVPTTVELGLHTAISSATRGIMGPKGIPTPILKKIQEIFFGALKNPEHVEKMETAGLAIKPLLGEDYAKYFGELHERCKELVKVALKDR